MKSTSLIVQLPAPTEIRPTAMNGAAFRRRATIAWTFLAKRRALPLSAESFLFLVLAFAAALALAIGALAPLDLVLHWDQFVGTVRALIQ